MTKILLCALLASLTAAPALAQIAAPAGPGAPPAANVAIAHHDRLVARRAARNGNWRGAAEANHAANVARAQAVNPQ